MKAPKTSTSAIIAKNQDIGKEIVTNLSTSVTFNPLPYFFNALLIPSVGALRDSAASSQFSHFIS